MLRALVRRDYLINRSYRFTLTLDLLFGLLNLVIYFFISETFGEPSGAELAGAKTYFDFAAVGVALSIVVQATSVRLAQRIREEQLTGTFEALVAQPITPLELSLGISGFHFVFALLRVILYIAAADLLLGMDLSQANWPAFALVLLASSVAMIPVGIVAAAVVLLVKRAEFMIGVTTLVLGLVGGAFFPVSVLPGWLQPIAEVVPTRFAFDGARAALFVGDGWLGDTAALLVFSALASPAALYSFRGALLYAKNKGSLATY